MGRAQRGERAAGRHRHDRHRTRPARRGEPRAVDRVDREVDRRAGAGAEALADEEHRRLVLLALPDDHDAVDVETGERRTQRAHGEPVDLVTATRADQRRRGERGVDRCGEESVGEAGGGEIEGVVHHGTIIAQSHS